MQISAMLESSYHSKIITGYFDRYIIFTGHLYVSINIYQNIGIYRNPSQYRVGIIRIGRLRL
jgi:hypothetical protein